MVLSASRGLLMGASKALDRQNCRGPSIPTTQWIQFGGAVWEPQGPQRLLDAPSTPLELYGACKFPMWLQKACGLLGNP